MNATTQDAYWLDGTPYCAECVLCDTPCLSDEERDGARRGPACGNCACCGRTFQTDEEQPCTR